MSKCRTSRQFLIAAAAGAACAWPFAAIAADDRSPPTSSPVTADAPVLRIAPPAMVDDPIDLELARKLGLDQVHHMGGERGLPACPDIVFDTGNCHAFSAGLGAFFSNAGENNFRSADNFVPLSNNPDRLCWVGRYADRLGPAVADEVFEIRIFSDNGGLPDVGTGPIFTRQFRQTGTAGFDFLELDCLDGQSCPGSTTPPASGGAWIFSVQVNGGFPVDANGCYWLEIANVGSSAAGRNWGWGGSQTGNDLVTLQAVNGAYTANTRQTDDRAFCFSGGVAGLNAFGCVTAPQPPVCENPAANGIAYDNATGFGMRASWTGSVGRPAGAGAWTPFQRAENVSFNAATTVTSICFGGFWLGVNDAGQTVGIAPPSNPQFRVAYFTNSDTLGVPGAPIPAAEFAAGDPGVSFVWDGDDVVNITHPPVNLPGNACSWVSVGRVQSQQAVGQPVAPLWHWQLTTNASPVADRRFATRTVGTGAPGAWGPTTVTDGGAQGTAISNLWFLFDNGPAVARVCTAAACQIPIPGGVIQENEANCGLAGGDTTNGGCNSTPPVFSQIACGQTVRGTVAFDGGTRDTDWYQFTLTQQQQVTVTVNAEFIGFAGFIGAGGEPIVNLDCSTPGIAISPFMSVGSCTPQNIVRTLGPGTWTLIVVPDFGNTIDCGNNTGSEYTLNVTCGAPPTPPANDLCQNAAPLATPCVTQDVTVSGTTLASTNDNQGACGLAEPQSTGGVWYTVVGNGSPITASLCTGTNYDAQISIFTGACGATVCVTGDDDGCGTVGGPSTVTWSSVNGTTYRILVHGWGTSTGNFSLTLTSSASCGGGCPADWNGDGQVNSQDISAFITAWLNSVNQGNLIADFNGDGLVNSSDISAFITAWLAAVNQGC